MPTIFFTINDTPIKQGLSPLNLAGTYLVGGGETITIADRSGNPARIKSDELLQMLWLENAVITCSTAPCDNVKFSFWMTFNSLNTGTVTYSVEGSGSFTRSTIAADPKDWISARGTVETTVLGTGNPDHLPSTPPNPPNCAAKLTSCATEQLATWTFNLTKPNGGFKIAHYFGGTSGNPSLVSTANDMKVEFWVHLQKTSDKLTITAAPGIRVKFGPPSGRSKPVARKPKKSVARKTKKK